MPRQPVRTGSLCLEADPNANRRHTLLARARRCYTPDANDGQRQGGLAIPAGRGWVPVSAAERARRRGHCPIARPAQGASGLATWNAACLTVCRLSRRTDELGSRCQQRARASEHRCTNMNPLRGRGIREPARGPGGLDTPAPPHHPLTDEIRPSRPTPERLGLLGVTAPKSSQYSRRSVSTRSLRPLVGSGVVIPRGAYSVAPADPLQAPVTCDFGDTAALHGKRNADARYRRVRSWG
jgi:hypothetical protein